MPKKRNYPQLVEGDKVKVNRDVMRWPSLAFSRAGGHGYGDPVVYVPAGTPATVKPFIGDSYLVYPENIPGYSVHLHIASLDIELEQETGNE